MTLDTDMPLILPICTTPGMLQKFWYENSNRLIKSSRLHDFTFTISERGKEIDFGKKYVKFSFENFMEHIIGNFRDAFLGLQ